MYPNPYLMTTAPKISLLSKGLSSLKTIKWGSLFPSLTLVRENNELDIEISSFFIIIYCVLLTYYDIM